MVKDLSLEHRPITSLFSQPSSQEEWLRYRLTEEQVMFYCENGYLSGIDVLDDEQIEVLRIELSELLNPDHPGRELFYEYNSNEAADPATVLFHALGAWRVSSGFHDLLWSPAFLVPASQLLVSPVRFWHDQIFYKPPHHGGIVAWHQDYSYWTRTQPMAHLSCWIGLDDASTENGCVNYVPRSHRWDLLPITGLANDMEAIKTVLTNEQKSEFKPIPIQLRAGQASFHHPLMIHGSFENKTEYARRAAVLNVFADGVKSASDLPPLEGVPAIPSGERMKGQFFPLLFDPAVVSKNWTDKTHRTY
ncbi:MAG TPA: phytanoyl-CoA dioxygenase family protein [Pyrinomonadaceae bacterium]